METTGPKGMEMAGDTRCDVFHVPGMFFFFLLIFFIQYSGWTIPTNGQDALPRVSSPHNYLSYYFENRWRVGHHFILKTNLVE